MSRRRLICNAAFLLSVIGLTVPCVSVPAVESNNASKAKPAAPVEQPYLGIAVAAISDTLRSQLANVLNDDRGVLVVDVAKNSPAAGAGIHRNDILLTYDEQNLFAPEQLVKLVRRDHVGRSVKLQFVRAGKTEDATIVLGKVAIAAEPSSSHSQRQMPQSSSDRAERWRSFDSMSLTRLDKDRFKAEVKFRDDQGKIESHVYEGTHDEIHKAIEAEKHLPINERRHLLRALDLPMHPFEFPGFRWVPEEELKEKF
jgi:hypothetical protein